MSVRPWASVVVLVLGFTLLCANVFSINRLLVLTNELERTQGDARAIVLTQRAGCERGNVNRENDRYVLDVLARVSGTVAADAENPELRDYFSELEPELRRRAKREELQHIDCDATYPLPQ